MALKTVVDSLEGLDDPIKTLYVEKDGKFVLDADIPDVTGLKSALDAERKATKDAERKAAEMRSKFKDVDPVRYAELVKEHEDRAAHDAGVDKAKLDELVAARVKLQQDESARLVAEAKTAEAKAIARLDKYRGRVLDDAIRQAAGKVGLHQQAIDDALFRGRTLFTLNDDGAAVQLDSNGNAVLGKDGKTPFGPEEWLESMREVAPHWFPAGLAGKSKVVTGGSGANLKRSTMTPREKADYIDKYGRAQFEALAWA